jgi:hypothetical protein
MKFLNLRGLLLSLILISNIAELYSQTINFTSLNEGDILSNQFQLQGILFLPYSNSIKGEVAKSAAGNIALFDVCATCEFYPSVANISFTGLHQHIKITVGITPRGGNENIQQEVTATGYNAAGQVVGGAALTVSASSGFSNELSINSSSPSIVSVEVRAIDQTSNTNLGISSITIDNPNFSTPDFTLAGNSYYELTSGGRNIPTQLTILRYGGSTGNIVFSAADLPPGVHAVFPFNPEPDAVCIMAIVTDPSAISGSYSFKVIGTPESPSVGPAQRTFTVNVKVNQAFNLFGLRNINFDNVPNNGSGKGSISIPLTVVRDGRVTGPATISIDFVPSDVQSAFSKNNLIFAGNSVGDNTVLTFTANAGIEHDALLVIHVSNGELTDDFFMSVFGRVPRINKNFIIKGSFSANQLGVLQPVNSALVQIYRDVHWGFDDNVGEALTDSDGKFEIPVSTNDIDTYYAKLKLTDYQGVSLKDSWSADIWDINSLNRGDNRAAVIDLGETWIANEGGKTTRASIFQGAHFAFQDYLSMGDGEPPYGDYQVKMWKAFPVPFSLEAETVWPEDSPTSNSGAPLKKDNFHDYSVSFHEFGHTLRHYVDGNHAHFVYDAERFRYAHEHNVCESYNEGYAFNEGWAEFWAKEPADAHNNYTCPAVPDFSVEFKVAFDLTNLMTCSGLSRKDMYNVLRLSAGVIHSDAEYRGRLLREFPGVDLSKCPPFVEPPPGGKPSPHSTVIILDSIQIVHAIEKDIRVEGYLIDSLKIAIRQALSRAQDVKKEKSVDPKILVEGISHPFVLQAQEEEAILLQHVFMRELEAVKNSQRIHPNFDEHFIFEADSAATQFDLQTRNIVSKLLNKDIEALSPFIIADKSGNIKSIVGDIKRKLQMLPMKTSDSHNWLAILNMPKVTGDHVIAISQNGNRHTLIIVIAIVLALILLALLINFWRKR